MEEKPQYNDVDERPTARQREVCRAMSEDVDVELVERETEPFDVETRFTLEYLETFARKYHDRERKTTVDVLEDGRVCIKQGWAGDDRGDVVVLPEEAVEELTDSWGDGE